MLNIMSIKKKNAADAAAGGRSPKTSATKIRLQKDMDDLTNIPKTMTVSFPNPDDLFNFNLTITPDDGFYKGGVFRFSFKVKEGYPHEAPKVLCTQKIYHPNIDLEGNVCLNILREDWKPVLNINSVMIGLQYIFLEPNPDDPLNKEAAVVLNTNRTLFVQNVNKSMRGGVIGGVTYDNVLQQSTMDVIRRQLLRAEMVRRVVLNQAMAQVKNGPAELEALPKALSETSPSVVSSHIERPIRVSESIRIAPSQRENLLNCYSADVNLVEFAKKDPQLSKLPLVDQWLQTKLAREIEMAKRGKPVRVGVFAGRIKAPESDGKGKKKKKK
ncbi:NEDD8-conjugating protein ubc12 [Physocladia obscura]|uniref:NEDD8-conjugating enzyme UBC12 n=1 Tax=Physocladia obscura TaxID=109957 RepID=A0AAD5TAT0_9FUNG|nr:NEDD8-conjugating protein ubc12 [Physocladia obscura]